MWALANAEQNRTEKRARALAIFRGRWGVDGASVHPCLFCLSWVLFCLFWLSTFCVVLCVTMSHGGMPAANCPQHESG